MGLKLSNNASGLLALAISDSDTSLTLEAGHGSRFPALGSGDWFPITVVRASDPSQFEIMRCTARTLDTLTVERAQEGTSALAFDPGDVVELRLTAGTLEEHFPQMEEGDARKLRFSVDPDTQGKPELTVHGENGESTAFALKGELGARDLNAVFEDGLFVQPSDAGALAALNYPAEKAGVLTVKAVAAGVCTQQYFALDGTLYARTATGGSWSQWNRVLGMPSPIVPDTGLWAAPDGSGYQAVDDEQMLNALGIPAGKPTADPAAPITGSLLSGAMLAAGAIVEMGENANGSYWRWESGLQVCVMMIPASQMTANTLYTNTIPFPAGFFRDDVVYPLVFPVLSYGPSNTSDFAFNYLGTTAITSATFDLYAKATVTQAYPIRAIAIGRWK